MSHIVVIIIKIYLGSYFEKKWSREQNHDLTTPKQKRRCIQTSSLAIALFASRCCSSQLVSPCDIEFPFLLEEQSEATYIGQARCHERLSLCRFDMRLLLAVIDGDEGAGNRVMFAELSGDVGCETCRPHPWRRDIIFAPCMLIQRNIINRLCCHRGPRACGKCTRAHVHTRHGRTRRYENLPRTRARLAIVPKVRKEYRALPDALYMEISPRNFPGK